MTGTRRRERNIIRAAIDANKPCRVRLRNYHKDGSLFWNELSITPILNEEDGITYYIGVQKDVSREVGIEQQLAEEQQRIKELEERIASLTNSK